MRIGIFGGTFNPVHSGHVLLAERYLSAFALDRLLVIPTFTPPHKQSPDLLSGEHRLAMCRLAFAELRGCEVSDIELRRSGRSYTVETLVALERAYPAAKFSLLMGSDMFLTFTQWRSWRQIAVLAELCVGTRDPALLPALRQQAERLTREGAHCRMVELEPLPVSSTGVRELVAAGESLDSVVPPKVAAYIADNRLYR